MEVKKQRLFGNSNILFQGKSLFYSSFSKSHIKTIGDIWDDNTKDFKSCNEIYRQLIDKRNCISEYSRIKSSIPQTFMQILKNNDDQPALKSNKIKMSENLEFLNPDNKIIKIKDLTLKYVQLNINITETPKCQTKWENLYSEYINLEKIWLNLSKIGIFIEKLKNFNGNVYTGLYILKTD